MPVDTLRSVRNTGQGRFAPQIASLTGDLTLDVSIQVIGSPVPAIPGACEARCKSVRQAFDRTCKLLTVLQPVDQQGPMQPQPHSCVFFRCLVHVTQLFTMLNLRKPLVCSALDACRHAAQWS